jgi:hypothetical protein
MIRFQSYSRFALTLTFASLPAMTTAQTKVEQQNPPSRVIRCVIDTERRDWKSNEPAIVTGQIESLFDGPVEVKIVPVLYLSSATSDALRAKYWSPVDVLHDTALSTDRQVIGPKAKAKAISIESVPILLQFKKKGDSIKFKFDARHTLWARQISSVWPSESLFSVIESGAYNLQLVLEADEGNSESQKLRIQIDSLKSEKK